MKLGTIAILVAIATPCIAGIAYVSKLAGDTLWVPKEEIVEEVVAVGDERYVPVGAYQKEQLYQLEDKLFEFELKEKYEGTLTPREQEQADRLQKRIERLEKELQNQ